MLCGHGGFYGLEAYWDTTGGERAFKGFKLHDIGATLPIIDKSLEYKFCSFHVIGNADETTLFLAVKESGSLYHYLYLNESSIDETYGFTEIDSVVVDQLIVQPSEVFSWVDSVRELDTVNIALTDYGFWDIEANQTNNITYSYRNGKSYENNVTPSFNEDNTKLIDPTISLESNPKYCEYSHEYEDSDENYGIDRLWEKNGENWYYCHGIELDSTTDSILDRYKNYRSSIVGNNGKTLNLVGCTEHFAVYNSRENDPVHILVNLSEQQFKNLLFSDAELTNYFIEWLYEQVTHPITDVPSGTTREEWYLHDWHFGTYGSKRGFIVNLSESLTNNGAGHKYSDLHFQLGETYSSTEHPEAISLALSSKFERVVALDESHPGIVSGDNTMTQYCTSLNGLVNSKTLDVNWLVDAGISALTGKMRELFYDITWNEKRPAFVDGVVDALIGEFPLLEYFRTYLRKHINSDLYSFSSAILDETPSIELTDDEKIRVINAVQEYIKGKVGTALVLGGYRDSGPVDNTRYPNIDQYLQNTERKISKL